MKKFLSPPTFFWKRTKKTKKIQSGALNTYKPENPIDSGMSTVSSFNQARVKAVLVTPCEHP
jgi:hypothetical protein